MAIDPYGPCPGGTGKKIKFCCADLNAELDKMLRMLESDQRLACLEHVKRAAEKHGERQCLLAIRSMLESQLGNTDALEQTVAQFLNHFPDNPIAHAESAMMAAGEGKLSEAVDHLQRSLEIGKDVMAGRVYEALGVVAVNLLGQGQILPARGLLMLQAEAAGDDDDQPIRLLMRVLSSPQVPLLMKEDFAFATPPADAPWMADFEAAMQMAVHGSWRAAAARLEELIAKAPEEPALWTNLAILRGWLGKNTEAAQAWRKLAQLSIPLDEAIEAEALAQLLDESLKPEEVDVVRRTYPVVNQEELDARLAGGHATRMPMDLPPAGDDQPPPRAVYRLLDRAMPRSGADLDVGDVPNVLATLLVYGRQTDREARIELVAARTELDAADQAMKSLAGDALGASTEDHVESTIPANSLELSVNWELPPDMPMTRRSELFSRQHREILLERWPNLRHPMLAGKTPAEAAADPAQQIPVQAAILQLELAEIENRQPEVFNELRRKLNLPTSETIDPQAASGYISLPRLARLDYSKLTDVQLVQAFRRAVLVNHAAALRSSAKEIIARPSLDGQMNKAEVFGTLARVETDPQQALSYIHQGRAVSSSQKQSTAPWDLQELALQLALENEPEVARLVARLRDRHMREPGVAQALYQILMQAGRVGPDGSLLVGPAEPQGSSLVLPGGAASGESKLWTPGGDQPAGERKSLWTPGG